VTGPEHYARAEELLAESRRTPLERDEPGWVTPAELITEAQVHATLALAAAVAFGGIPIATLADAALAAEWTATTGVTP
jgi:hypothetical protein